MPCDTRLKFRQTISQRAVEVKAVVEKISSALGRGTVKAVISRKGGITFTGLSDADRDAVTDACIYRRIMTSGSALAKHMIAKAEAQAGVTVDKKVIASGHHSHDGGETWHDGH